MSKRPIVLVAHPDTGGSGVVARDLAGLLADAGRDVTLLTPRPRSPQLAPGVRHVAVDAGGYPGLLDPEPCVAMAGALAAVPIGALVHVHYALPWLPAAVLARTIGARFRLICTLHGTDIVGVGGQAPYRAVIEPLLRQADAVLAPSAALAARIAEAMPAAPPIAVVPNFVDGARFRPLGTNEREALRRDLCPAAAPGEFWIAHVSNFRPVKRTDRLAGIVARLPDRAAVRVLLIGDGPERAAAERDLRGVLGDRLIVRGVEPSAAPLLPAADALLLPSDYESFGLAALEAMACGVPVVASDVGGVGEVLGGTGILCRPDDLDGFASALHRLRAPDLRDRLGRAGRVHALADFGPDAALRRHLALYDPFEDP